MQRPNTVTGHAISYFDDDDDDDEYERHFYPEALQPATKEHAFSIRNAMQRVTPLFIRTGATDRSKPFFLLHYTPTWRK